MTRFFNTTGPCDPERHYMLAPEARLVGAQLDRYIDSQLYWVLHAPRQTGKTTFLRSWMRKINAEAAAVACYVSVERCQEFPDAGKDLLIQERAVHLDSLIERLRDARVKNIVQLILTGESDPELMRGDDFRFTLDMGLVTIEGGSAIIANPIYREIIARVLSEPYQLSIPAPEFRWQKADGSLDLDALFREFQNFWAQHAEPWEAKADYTEALPHLLLMAFLQRVVNGGGRIEREYAAGRGRVDLVVFDRTPAGRAKSWEERLTWDVAETSGGPVTVVGG